MLDLNLNHQAPPAKRKDYGIGVVGAGFIVRDVQLVAYAHAGYNVRAIACDAPALSCEVARLRGSHRSIARAGEQLRDRRPVGHGRVQRSGGRERSHPAAGCRHIAGQLALRQLDHCLVTPDLAPRVRRAWSEKFRISGPAATLSLSQSAGAPSKPTRIR